MSLFAKYLSVDRVSDGDTVTATTSGGTKLRLRLLGIDAPEVANDKKPGQPYGEEAREYLEHLIGGKVVRVDADGSDGNYGNRVRLRVMHASTLPCAVKELSARAGPFGRVN